MTLGTMKLMKTILFSNMVLSNIEGLTYAAVQKVEWIGFNRRMVAVWSELNEA